MSRIVLLSKTDSFSRQAQAIAKKAFGARVEMYEGAVGDTRPQALLVPGDTLISFLSPWIITAQELACFRVAINFHPGSVEYPGTGCYNIAIAEEAREYGAVCHHMLPKVDTGRIIREARFPMSAEDTVESLKFTTMNAMLDLFAKAVYDIAHGEPLPLADTHWTRPAFRRHDMEALKNIDATLPPEVIARLVRATVYPGFPGPKLRFPDGLMVEVAVPHRLPLA